MAADDGDIAGVDAGLLIGLPERGLLRRLVAVAGPARNAPGVGVGDLGGSMLQEHLALAADEQAGRPEPAPVPVAEVASGPSVTVVFHLAVAHQDRVLVLGGHAGREEPSAAGTWDSWSFVTTIAVRRNGSSSAPVVGTSAPTVDPEREMTSRPTLMLNLLSLEGPAASAVHRGLNGPANQDWVRFVDAEHVRPGLPEDVPALVSSIDRLADVVTLVSGPGVGSRSMVLHAGVCAQHDIRDVADNRTESGWSGQGTEYPHHEVRVDELTMSGDGPGLDCDLPAGTRIILTLRLNLQANRPSCRDPWSDPAGLGQPSTVGVA